MTDPDDQNYKRMTLRISERHARLIEAIADVEGVAQIEVIRGAIEEHITRARKDPKKRKQIQSAIKRHLRTLKELA